VLETPLVQRLRLLRDAAASSGSRAWKGLCDSAYRDVTELCGRPDAVVALTFYVPPEIPAALGLIPVGHEFLAAAAAAIPAARPVLAAAAYDLAPATVTCGYQRMFWGLIASGWIPSPRAFLAATLPCDDAWKMFEVAAARLHRPFQLIEIPGAPGHASSEARARAYVARQLATCAARLGAATGTRLAPEAVARTVELSNRALTALRRVDRLRQERPGILPAPQALRYFTLHAKLGTPEAAEVFETLAEELNAPTPSGPAGLLAPGTPRKRVLWLGMPPLFMPALTAELEERYAVSVVYEEPSAFEGGPLAVKSFFDDLAARLLAQPGVGPPSRRAAALVRLARRFSADGVVHFSYPQCRALLGSAGYVAAACRRAGIPFAEVTGEVIDPGSHDAGRMCAQLEAFMARIGARLSGRAGGR
jgi:benzoyl-CoA reductase/2-hydroxyglutaryl-CoA dehydratase subunit BcrC/BadD/HgdB